VSSATSDKGAAAAFAADPADEAEPRDDHHIPVLEYPVGNELRAAS
jgi:hypothetical protein